MNLISQAFGGFITWVEAEARIAAQAAAIGLQGVGLVAVSSIKQFASDAIGQADTAISTNYANVAKAAETALEAELAVLTRGVTTPLNPLISKGIDDLAEAAAKAAHAWALAAKAELAAPPAQTTLPLQANATLSDHMNQDSRD